MKILRLDHVNIHTGRFDETVGFYVDGLGLSRGPLPGPFGEPGSEMKGAWLCDAAGSAIVHLLHDEEASAGGVSAVDHFALGCDDYDGFLNRLTDRRIDFEAADYPEIGVRQIVVRDPNGVKIELNFPS
jgi:catechol 2,3-dioxygenase-like lactoylglutathione lyase family enzyme